jgi:hypothetical protein
MKARPFRHHEVQEHHVGRITDNLHQRLSAVGRNPDNVPGNRQQFLVCLCFVSVVIHNQNFGHRSTQALTGIAAGGGLYVDMPNESMPTDCRNPSNGEAGFPFGGG